MTRETRQDAGTALPAWATIARHVRWELPHTPRALGVAGGVAVLLATGVLYAVSRGKWSDAIIDSGREWIVPDAISRGQLLYRDVVYWFGPFTPYFQAAFFRAFGSSLATLVLSGAAAACGTLAVLYLAARRVAGRAEAACAAALAIPVFVFMPNAGGPLLGMGYRIWHAATFGLLAIAVACRRPHAGGSGGLRLVSAGALAALAGLCRTEWGLVALTAVLLCRCRLSRRRRGLAEAGLVLAGFLLLFGGVLFVFIARAGAGAVLTDGHALLTGLPAETRRFVVAFSTIADWKHGILELLYSSGMWLGAFLVIALLAARRPNAPWPRKRVPELIALVVLLGVLALLGGASGAVLFSTGPLVCLIAFAAGLTVAAGPRAAALSAFGLTGLLLSYRRPFHIGDSAYVGPPLLFALVCGIGLLRLAVVSEKDGFARRRLRRALLVGIASVAALAFGGRLLQYASDSREAVPGTEGMLSARPAVARELTGLALAVRRQTAPAEGLVVFPEGEVLNLLSGRRNPIRHKLYLPGYLTSENESEVLAELAKARPAAIVIWLRPTSEYGHSLFGKDYGRRIRGWIEENYVARTFETGRRSRTTDALLYLSRRPSP